MATLRKQMSDATDRMRQHLKERIALMQTQIASLETEQQQAQKSLIDIQSQRDRLGQLQHGIEFRAEQLSARERAAEQAKLKSKLTFSDMTVLDKAFPPVHPAFPKPFVVMPVGIVAGLALGLILAVLAEATDRRVRFPVDLGYERRPRSWALLAAQDARKRVLAHRAAPLDPPEFIFRSRSKGRFGPPPGSPPKNWNGSETIGG